MEASNSFLKLSSRWVPTPAHLLMLQPELESLRLQHTGEGRGEGQGSALQEPSHYQARQTQREGEERNRRRCSMVGCSELELARVRSVCKMGRGKEYREEKCQQGHTTS